MSLSQREAREVADVMRHHWNARAATFDRELGHGVHSDVQRQEWRTLLRRLTGDAPMQILDVGCGTGVLSLMLDELGHRVTGADLAPGMIEVAASKARDRGARVTFRVENAVALTDASETYDLVLARHLIWTLPDPAGGVAEWRRVLKRNGRLALVEGKWAENEAKPRYDLAPRSCAIWLQDKMLALASALVGRKHWKLYAREYRHLQAQLPFSGGPPAARLIELLGTCGFEDVTLEPLTNPALWGEQPRFPRYLVTAQKAACAP